MQFIKSRLLKVSDLQKKLVCLDIESIAACLVGERNVNGIVKIDEELLETFGLEEFKEFYEYICSQDHIKDFAESNDIFLDPSLSHVVYRRLKSTLKELIWNPKMIEIFERCIHIVTKDGKVTPLHQSKDLEMANKPTKEGLGKLMMLKKSPRGNRFLLLEMF